MSAAEGIKIGPPCVNVATAIRHILIRWNGTRAQRAIRIRPGAVGVQQGNVFAYEKRVAGAVRYRGQVDFVAGNIIPACEHAVARIESVARAAVALVLIIAPAPAIAGDSLV